MYIDRFRITTVFIFLLVDWYEYFVIIGESTLFQSGEGNLRNYIYVIPGKLSRPSQPESAHVTKHRVEKYDFHLRVGMKPYKLCICVRVRVCISICLLMYI